MGEQDLTQLMELLGGHPYLVQETLTNLKSQQMALEELLTLAPTEEGIFSHHLREQLECLQDNPQLESAYKRVVTANEPVQLNPEITFKLHSLGLVKIVRNDCVPSCDLYREYFSIRLSKSKNTQPLRGICSQHLFLPLLQEVDHHHNTHL